MRTLPAIAFVTHASAVLAPWRCRCDGQREEIEFALSISSDVASDDLSSLVLSCPLSSLDSRSRLVSPVRPVRGPRRTCDVAAAPAGPRVREATARPIL
jgi:hypothetical protein